MSRKTENTAFKCINCGTLVPAIAKGSIRNHCPLCLFSMHLDEEIGDRQSLCWGLMEPVAIESHSKKGWQILHQCKRCGFTRKNILAVDDNINEVARIMKEKL